MKDARSARGDARLSDFLTPVGLSELPIYLEAMRQHLLIFLSAGPFLIDRLITWFWPSGRKWLDNWPHRRSFLLWVVIFGAFYAGFLAWREEHDRPQKIDATASEAPRQSIIPVPPTQPANDNTGQIQWDGDIFIYGNGDSKTPAIKILMYRGTNIGRSEIQLHDAFLISGDTGERIPLLVSIPYGRLDGENIPVDQTNPIPAGARIQLVAEWKPSLQLLEFYNQWGKINMQIDYNDTHYKRSFDDEHMKMALTRDIVGADLLLGIPRVTKKTNQ